ncbi:MAG: glycosyltransferase family 2 protein [Armatimonadota bacterium]
MEKLSVIIITKNEENCIRECLESVKWADEIVVVDSGSTDKTEEICREYTDKFFYNEWPGSNRQRQLAADKCSNLWTIFIDSDEAVSPELAKNIQSLLKTEPKCDVYKVLRRNYYRDRPAEYGVMHPKPEIRLFRRDRVKFIDRSTHAKLVYSGKSGSVKGYLEHYNITELKEWYEKNLRYARACAEDDFTKGKRVGFRHFAGLPNLFFRRYILWRGFLHGVPGLVFSAMPVFFRLVHYSIMWELQSNSRGEKQPKQ